MQTLDFDQITENLQDLPSLPAIVMELLNTLDDENLDVAMLAKKVTQDLALTAKTIRFANSAYYATMVKVTTIQQAITLMGLSQVKQIVLSAALSGCFPENNCRGFDHKAFWRHSNAVAFTAKLIARRIKFSEEVAYIGGLLHDLGILVLVTLYPREYEEVIAYKKAHLVTQKEAERQILGVDHAQIGEALAHQWNFSDAIKNAIAAHHEPDQTGSGFLPCIVHVADGIAHMLGVATVPDTHTITLNLISWQNLSLDQASVDTLIEEAAIKFKKLGQFNL